MSNFELIFAIIVIIFCIYIMIKNDNTYNKREIIAHAIFCLRIRDYDTKVNYDNMEDYNKTLFRLFDWGYNNIINKEDFKLIEPYIKLDLF